MTIKGKKYKNEQNEENRREKNSNTILEARKQTRSNTLTQQKDKATA